MYPMAIENRLSEVFVALSWGHSDIEYQKRKDEHRPTATIRRDEKAPDYELKREATSALIKQHNLYLPTNDGDAHMPHVVTCRQFTLVSAGAKALRVLDDRMRTLQFQGLKVENMFEWAKVHLNIFDVKSPEAEPPHKLKQVLEQRLWRLRGWHSQTWYGHSGSSSSTGWIDYSATTWNVPVPPAPPQRNYWGWTLD